MLTVGINRQKIIFTYEQEEKEKTIISLKKIEGDIKSLMNLLIMNSALMAEDIVKKKVWRLGWRYLKSRRKY